MGLEMAIIKFLFKKVVDIQSMGWLYGAGFLISYIVMWIGFSLILLAPRLSKKISKHMMKQWKNITLLAAIYSGLFMLAAIFTNDPIETDIFNFLLQSSPFAIPLVLYVHFSGAFETITTKIVEMEKRLDGKFGDLQNHFDQRFSDLQCKSPSAPCNIKKRCKKRGTR